MELRKVLFQIILVFTCFGTGMVHGQDEKKNYLGMHFSFGDCDYLRGAVAGTFTFKNYDATGFKSLGFDYARTSDNLDLCLGIVFISNSLTSTSTGWYGGGSYDDQFFMFSFPVHMKYHFLKYLFLDGGFCFNLHPSMGYKWGLGAGVGAGVEYVFGSGISVSLYPFMQWSLLNVGSQGGSAGGADVITQKGIRIGAGYWF